MRKNMKEIGFLSSFPFIGPVYQVCLGSGLVSPMLPFLSHRIIRTNLRTTRQPMIGSCAIPPKGCTPISYTSDAISIFDDFGKLAMSLHFGQSNISLFFYKKNFDCVVLFPGNVKVNVPIDSHLVSMFLKCPLYLRFCHFRLPHVLNLIHVY